MIATNFIIIEKLDAVGMHHWSHRKLAHGEILKLVREPDNPKDPNAIALYDQHQISKLAYLGWSDALQMCKVMLHEKVLNKVNMKAIVTGKMGSCSLGTGTTTNMQCSSQGFVL